jgi:hypothetical protein
LKTVPHAWHHASSVFTRRLRGCDWLIKFAELRIFFADF